MNNKGNVSFILPKKNIYKDLEPLAARLEFDVAAANLRMAVDGNISQDRLNGEELSEKILKVYKIQKELNKAVGEILKEEEADMFPSAQLGALPNLEYIAQISGGKIFKGRLPILKGETPSHSHQK